MIRCSAIVFLTAFLTLGAEPEATRMPQANEAPDWRTRIEKALDAEFSVNFVETPLADFADFVAEQAGINVLVDRRALEDVGIGDDTPVTISLKGISLRSVLRLELRELELTWTLRDGVLLITTPEEADGWPEYRLFDVRDLATPADPPLAGRYDCREIVDLLTSCVVPPSWDIVGGPGAIESIRGQLLVNQSREVLDMIEVVLARLRRAVEISKTHSDKSPPQVAVGMHEDSPAYKRIEAALGANVSVDFEEIPLKEVAKFVAELLNVPVQIDLRALDGEGISDDLPVTFSADEMKARYALRYILRELGLTYIIRDEVILITTPTECESELVTQFYPVADILGKEAGRDTFGDAIRPITVDELIRLCQCVHPQTWDDLGGPGSAVMMESADVLVVSQSNDAHEELTQILTELRENLAQAPPARQVEFKPAPAVLRVYTLASAVAVQPAPDQGEASEREPNASARKELTETELLTLIRELIDPPSWSVREDVYSHAAGGRVIVRHTESVHQQIKQLFARLHVKCSESVQAQPQPRYQGMGSSFF